MSLGKNRRLFVLVGLLVMALMVIPFRQQVRGVLGPIKNRLRGLPTVADRVAEHGTAARERLLPRLEAAGVAYPPSRIVLVGIKDEDLLELWVAESADAPLALVHRHPILAASGRAGPKLREGDMQVPEGFYRIESLNPNSRFHLSLRLNYPNEFDLKHAKAEGRAFPGSDIMIHGNEVSIGCLAMGDPAAEELFVLAAEVGIENVSVILVPTDFRKHPFAEPSAELPDWVPGLYAELQNAMPR